MKHFFVFILVLIIISVKGQQALTFKNVDTFNPSMSDQAVLNWNEKQTGYNTLTPDEKDFSYWVNYSRLKPKVFFDSAEKNLHDLFANQAKVNPEDHLQQINQWLEALKNQWKFDSFNPHPEAYENYVNIMSKMCMDASDKMLKQWIQRYKQDKPIHSVRELYELWLNCCHEIYSDAIHSKSYQEAYGDFMNATIHFWKSVLPK